MKTCKSFLASVFIFIATNASALELKILSPANDAIVSSTQTLSLTTQALTSGYALKSISASLAGSTYTLDSKLIPNGRFQISAYTKDIKINDLKPNTYEIVFNAEDFSNKVISKSIFIRVGSPPRITSEKINFASAADGNLSVRVSAEDERQGIKISLACGGLKTELNSSANTINNLRTPSQINC